jgi:hypothetical protein
MTETLTLCFVCMDAVTSTSEAWCGACGNAYHLNQRTDVPGKDCGEVWINEDHMALEFACNRCLHPPALPFQPPPPPTPPTTFVISTKHPSRKKKTFFIYLSVSFCFLHNQTNKNNLGGLNN